MMREAFPVDLLTKVFIICDQDPTLGIRFSNNLFVVYSTCIIKHREDLVPLAVQPRGNCWPRTFVHKESHSGSLDC